MNKETCRKMADLYTKIFVITLKYHHDPFEIEFDSQFDMLTLKNIVYDDEEDWHYENYHVMYGTTIDKKELFYLRSESKRMTFNSAEELIDHYINETFTQNEIEDYYKDNKDNKDEWYHNVS